MALRLIACVLLLEITTFMRESYKSFPKMHRTLFPTTTTTAATTSLRPDGSVGRASHCWSELPPPPPVARSGSSAGGGMPSATLTAGSDSASRRWSIAKSVGASSLSSSTGHHATLEKQPSLQVIYILDNIYAREENNLEIIISQVSVQ